MKISSLENYRLYGILAMWYYPKRTFCILDSVILQALYVCLLLTVPAESLPDHLLAHNMEESDHQQLMVDSGGSKNDFTSLKVCVCVYIYIYVTYMPLNTEAPNTGAWSV